MLTDDMCRHRCVFHQRAASGQGHTGKARRNHREHELHGTRSLGSCPGDCCSAFTLCAASPRASVERNLPIENTSFHTQDAADTTDACPWDPTNWGVKDNAAGQAWYDSLMRQYASWGVDLLKVDCISDRPYKATEIQMIRRAIDKTGHPMVLSLSPGPTGLDHAAEVSKLATMWRISDDFWDTWAGVPGKTFPQSIPGQLDRLAQWSALGHCGGSLAGTPTCSRSASCGRRRGGARLGIRG